MSKNIYAKMLEVMSKVERVKKNGYNSFHKYEYVTESDLTEAIRPILVECGLAFFSTMLDQEREGEFTKVKMEFSLIDVDSGESLKSIYYSEGTDKTDKGIPKAVTSCVKYFLMKTFLIPTGDDPEGDTSVDERASKPDYSGYQKKSASEKQIGMIKSLLKGKVSEKYTYDQLLDNLKKRIGATKDIDQWTSSEASKAIGVLQN
ncbi:ERF family protein [Priestia megaterium]